MLKRCGSGTCFCNCVLWQGDIWFLNFLFGFRFCDRLFDFRHRCNLHVQTRFAPRVLLADFFGFAALSLIEIANNTGPTWTALGIRGDGPAFASLHVEPGDEGPISRSSKEARYLKTSLADWSRTMRAALVGSV